MSRRKPSLTQGPALPVAIEEDPDNVLVYENGETRTSYDLTYSEHDIGRIREGYCCIQCGEAQEKAMPKACWVCGFPMRDKQAQRFALEFKGFKRIGPQTSISDELAIAREMYEREEREKDARKLASQILLPGRDF